MPYDEPDATDPMTLHGVVCETADDSAVREMAECFIEEYLRLGFDAERLLALFRNRGFAGARLALEALGEERIRAMISEQAGWRRARPRGCEVERDEDGSLGLPVLRR